MLIFQADTRLTTSKMKLGNVIVLASLVFGIEGGRLHLDCCDRIAVGYIEKSGSSFVDSLFLSNPVAREHQRQVFGYYEKTSIRGYDRPVYEKEEDAIWYCGDDWYMGKVEDVGLCHGYAHANGETGQCVEDFGAFTWKVYDGSEFQLDTRLDVRCDS